MGSSHVRTDDFVCQSRPLRLPDMATKRVSTSKGINKTLLSPEEHGSEVVRAVVSKIESVFPSPSFAPGCTFLRLIAYVESKDGTDSRTYRSGYDGGIWQVDKKAFEDTKATKSHAGLDAKHAEIKKQFGIDWTQVQWSDLRKPFYSGLAARLFLYNIPEPIPVELEGQAKYWKDRYSTSAGPGARTEKHFVEDVLALVSEDLMGKFENIN